MGDVWRAADELLGRQVAVKLLKPAFGDDASFRLRFRAEARASASLSHPGVATVYDYGEEVAGASIRPTWSWSWYPENRSARCWLATASEWSPTCVSPV